MTIMNFINNSSIKVLFCDKKIVVERMDFIDGTYTEG